MAGSLYSRIRLKLLPIYLKLRFRPQSRSDLIFIGSTYGGWWAPSSLLNEHAIVYCVGCGQDITFDLGLIDRFGCQVHAYDPTPKAIRHVEQHGSHAKYHFEPIGLWSQDQQMTFYLNDNPDHVSGSLVGLSGTTQGIEVQVRTLQSVMKANGHDRIDLIKLDIEGAEYEVLESMVRDRIAPTCLMVEFDQPAPIGRTIRMIRTLQREGYDLVDIRGWNLLFILRRAA